MAERKRSYYKIFLNEVPRLQELEEEKEGTASTIVWEVLKYAYQHKDDPEAPANLPEAPAGFSLAARQEWGRLIETYQGQMESYIRQTEGGHKAKPGPGHPKGKKNTPRAGARSDDEIEEEEEDHREPAAIVTDPDDARITGFGPWLPSESSIKSLFWAEAISSWRVSETSRPTINAMASEVWARLQTNGGYLAPNGMGGIDKDSIFSTFDMITVLLPEEETPKAVHEKARWIWTLIDAWALMEGAAIVDLRTLLEGISELQDISFSLGFYLWIHQKGTTKTVDKYQDPQAFLTAYFHLDATPAPSDDLDW